MPPFGATEPCPSVHGWGVPRFVATLMQAALASCPSSVAHRLQQKQLPATGSRGLSIPDTQDSSGRRLRFVNATAFLIFGLSFVVFGIAAAMHGGTPPVIVGLAVMAISGVCATIAILDEPRKGVWAAATTATLGTGLAVASIGIFSLAGAPTLGFVLAGVFGPLLWISSAVFLHVWLRKRPRTGP